MRKEFSAWIAKKGSSRTDLIFLTGDLGFQALENVQKSMGHRFVNVGVSEQNMISLAAGMAQQGLTPFCYSIAPFAVFRPAEQIRLDVCIHQKNVKIVGNGGGYGYGIMGPTHHAIEDLAVLSSFRQMKCFVPFCNEDVETVCEAMLNYVGPSYLRLGFGALPEGLGRVPDYQPIRKIQTGSLCTIVGIGPVLLNACKALAAQGVSADVFAVSELPIVSLSPELTQSLQKTGKLFVLEEHVQRGGLGENLSLRLLEQGLTGFTFLHRYARGYPDDLYGSQSFHQKQSGLDSESIKTDLQRILHGKSAAQ